MHVYPWVGKIVWRRTWQLNPVFLPGEFCGWGLTESDMTEETKHACMYSTRNSTQYVVINHNGKEYEKECVCVCVCVY